MKPGKSLIILLLFSMIGCATENTRKSANSQKGDIQPIIMGTIGENLYVGINNGDIHIVFKCKAKEPKWKKANNSCLFLLDENTMIQTMTFSYDINTIPNDATEMDILKSNMLEETDYQQKYSDSKLELSHEVVNLKNQKALFWSLTSTGKNPGTNYYITLMKKRNHLIGINSVKINQNSNYYKKLLMDIANTVVYFDKPVTKETIYTHFNL